MPTYEYECSKCGHTFERFQNMSDEPLKRCPKCRCKVRRLLGVGAGIIFKGSGFYETDYKRKERPGKAAGNSAAQKSETAPGSEKKSTANDKATTADK
ncbi:MAG: FmdB family zinc ribbon protein [Verrucomicrobiota bacterium]